MSDLLEQRKAFQRRIAEQPVLQRHTIPRPSIGGTFRPSLGTATPQLDRAAVLGAHAMTKVHEIIEFLKKSQKPHTAEDIQRYEHVDIHQEETIYNQLMNNEKVIYHAKDRTFAYKPEYNIRNKEELLEYLRQMPDRTGLDVKKLRDSYLPDIPKVIADLRKEGLILTITNKDGNPKHIFYNQHTLQTPVDDDIKRRWAELRIPDEADLAFEMEKAGLKQMQVEQRVAQTEDKKKAKQRVRKVKITNTHLVDIDLTKDYVPEK
ncbi:transcription factor TFIIE beta subunit, TFIIEB, Tfa2 [Dipsacomyces acuminosporus]|nr:transcription factor TFIIE beta subunit, TFIIEB, Tfa2 [Dipsacomyces acuminosporus]